MTTNPPNTLPPEEDLLAWVEREALPPVREAAVLRAMAADAGLASTLTAMRRDCKALRDLPEVQAPPRLLQPIMGLVERRALLDMERSAHADPREATVRLARPRVWTRPLATPVGRGMALAASIMLVVGGGLWFALPYLGSGGKGSGGTTLALRTEAELLSEPADAETAHSALAMVEQPKGTDASASTLAAAPIEAGVAPVSDAPAAIDAARALVLAQEGRLAIVVRSLDAQRTVRRAELSRAQPSLGWRVVGSSEESVVASVLPGAEERVRWSATPLRSDVPRDVIAGDPARAAPLAERAIRIPNLGALRDLAAAAQAETPAVLTAEVRLTEEALESLRATLAPGEWSEAVFMELESPVPWSSAGLPSLHPSAVLWWRRPIESWESWGRVPVVVDPETP